MKSDTHLNIHLFLHFFFFFGTFLLCLSSSSSVPEEFLQASSHGGRGLTDAEAHYIRQRQLLYYRDEFGDRGEEVVVDPKLVFENDRIRNAYIALQAWKQAILSDPLNLTKNWVGSDVCHYKGVFCAPAPDNSSIRTVAGIDLNHGDIAGYLPEELGLLVDLALFHINSNRFCGTVPHKFKNLKLLFELDLSNNRFAGKFPRVVLKLPELKFLDLRFNEFEGTVPKELFDKDLDAIFINHNRFRFDLPENFGNSPVSVIVLANNKFHGCVPGSIGNMTRLNEIILMNNGFRSCLPPEIGFLKNLTVFDVSHNEFFGKLPDTIGGMVSLEQLNVAHNFLSGKIPDSICKLPNLQNFTYSYNFFTGEAPSCLALPDFDDRRNCIPDRPVQRSERQCKSFLSKPVDCSSFGCPSFVAPSPPVVVPSPPPVVVPSPPPVVAHCHQSMEFRTLPLHLHPSIDSFEKFSTSNLTSTQP
ncbi:leucine-rich repeat extensin-like protein 4 [Cucumis melo var. makuwa]|uniref:Cell wall hydroxyproline-rich glycoprotein n=1 Tax=Cucumis melo var. makuwa TaxID=1194695 RepID=A0A5A7V0A1_CUCMM|nr:leucine-rich repeat extensin-like protein 4 [Cucumis melo var. makuwa]